MAPESRDEVRQRIESLYDRAENETGNFNATRAMAAVTRSRGVPLAKRSVRRPEPALDEMTRQWFDTARAKLGPTVPAALPADRLPGRSPAPARSRELPRGGTPDARRPLELEQSPARRAVAELTAGGSAQDAPSGLPTEPAGGRAALPVPRQAELPVATADLGDFGGDGAGQFWTLGTSEQTAPGAWGASASMTPDAREPAPSPAQSTTPGATPGALEATAMTAPVAPGPEASPAPGAQGVVTLMAPAAQGASMLMTPGGQDATALMTPGALEATALTAPVAPGPEASPAPGAQGVVTLMAPAAQGASMLMTPGGQDATALMTPGALEATALTAPGVQGAAFERGSVETALAPVAGAPAALATPLPEPRTLPGAAAPGRPSLANSKASSRRKLAAASDVLSRYAARLAAPAPAVPAAPVPTDPPMAAPARPAAAQPGAAVTGPATGQWQASTGQWQQAQWGTAPQLPAGTVWPDAATSALTTGSFPPPAFAEAGVLQSPAMPTPGTGTGTGTGPIPYPTAPATAATAPSPTPESSRAARAAAAIAFARGQIGKPCVWGAMGPGSYDCSSLTQAAWRSAGVTLPRAAHEQALAGAPVTLAGAEPGDLVLFFDDDRHVGLHVGGGMMVHAPGPGSTIREESIYGAGEAAIHRIVRPA